MPETWLTSCDLLIFVEETAESVMSADVGGVRAGGGLGARVVERRVPVRFVEAATTERRDRARDR
jgi:hypothetical protein